MRATIFCGDIPTRDWDAFEIRGDGEYWVFIRFADNTDQWIADCPDRKTAEHLVKFLTALINTSEQPPAHT